MQESNSIFYLLLAFVACDMPHILHNHDSYLPHYSIPHPFLQFPPLFWKVLRPPLSRAGWPHLTAENFCLSSPSGNKFSFSWSSVLDSQVTLASNTEILFVSTQSFSCVSSLALFLHRHLSSSFYLIVIKLCAYTAYQQYSVFPLKVLGTTFAYLAHVFWVVNTRCKRIFSKIKETYLPWLMTWHLLSNYNVFSFVIWATCSTSGHSLSLWIGVFLIVIS